MSLRSSLVDYEICSSRTQAAAAAMGKRRQNVAEKMEGMVWGKRWTQHSWMKSNWIGRGRCVHWLKVESLQPTRPSAKHTQLLIFTQWEKCCLPNRKKEDFPHIFSFHSAPACRCRRRFFFGGCQQKSLTHFVSSLMLQTELWESATLL